MRRKFFGTIKSVSCDSNLRVTAIVTIPTLEYTLKGTENEKKHYALLRAESDVGNNLSFEYGDEVKVTGTAVSGFTSVLRSGNIVGFIFEDTAKKASPDINFNGVDGATGNGGGYTLKEIVLR